MQEDTSLGADGGDAVGLIVLFQAQLLLMQVDRGRVDSGALQVQTYPLTPQPPGETQRGEGSAPLLNLQWLLVRNIMTHSHIEVKLRPVSYLACEANPKSLLELTASCYYTAQVVLYYTS